MNIHCGNNVKWIYESLKLVAFFVAFVALCVVLSAFGHTIVNSFRDSERSSADAEIDKSATIVIDPGHGGFDGGAVSSDGVYEKDLNLAVSKYLRAFFTLGGYDAVMTRTDDTSLTSPNHTESKKRGDLFGRVEFTQEYDNPIFISIHQNKFEIQKYSGLQVYYSKHDSDSEIIAKEIQKYAKELLQPDNNREAKPAGSSILVLNNLKTPAVLVECGFLSNPSEAKLLEEDTYQRKLAFIIYLAVNDCLRKH